MTADDGRRYRRSPYLVLSWEGGELVLTQCSSLRRFRANDELIALLSQLDDWRASPELDDGSRGAPALEVLERLHAFGVLDRAEGGAAAKLWNPFDLFVQRQQNRGGERLAAHRQGPAPAAFNARPAGRPTVLPPAGRLDVGLGDVLAARRSQRSYGARRMALAELSSLLHHSARVTDVVCDEELGEQVFHPYPAGGARSELELYVVANGVESLPKGAHWYDARTHELVMVQEDGDELEGINRWVSEASGGLLRPPQVVLLVTAVFERVMWKYEGIALSLIARDVGCLYQTLYLVATALGLAPCAVGAGRELDNSAWLGLDPLIESQVGCVLVGTSERD